MYAEQEHHGRLLPAVPSGRVKSRPLGAPSSVIIPITSTPITITVL